MAASIDIVLLHGWGLCSAIWNDYAAKLEHECPNLSVHLIDLPGYGGRVSEAFPTDLPSLASDVLQRAPKSAIWVGWSLGGMVAMQAALQDKDKQILGMQLLACSPCFVSQPDWPSGVDTAVFTRFAEELGGDYASALSGFLLMQAGVSRDARRIAKSAHQHLGTHPVPNHATLMAGIECLAQSDLRPFLPVLAAEALPVQVLVGQLDRVANPQGGEYLANALSAPLVSLKTGHAPFLTDPDAVKSALLQLLEACQ